MIKIVENDITVEEYLSVRDSVGWRKLSDAQAQMAINKSLYIIKAMDEENRILGIGRIVGDGAVICYVQDLIVVPDAQGQGVGSAILERLKSYVLGIKEEGMTMMFCLMSAKGREGFYEKHGFLVRPNDKLGPGMIQFLK